jgi:hypothetical protein
MRIARPALRGKGEEDLMSGNRGDGASAMRQSCNQAELVRMRAEQYQMLADLARVEVTLRQHGECLLEQLSAVVEADAQQDAAMRRAELQTSQDQLTARHAALRSQLARMLKVTEEDPA